MNNLYSTLFILQRWNLCKVNLLILYLYSTLFILQQQVQLRHWQKFYNLYSTLFILQHMFHNISVFCTFIYILLYLYYNIKKNKTKMRLTYIYILLYLYYNVPASVMSCCVNSFIFYFIYITTYNLNILFLYN